MKFTNRKNLRLKGYDYSQSGAYFITICVKDKHEILWKNVGARIARPQENYQLSEYGIVTDMAINNISKFYPQIVINKYVIMPNHIHMILVILKDDRRAMRAPTISTAINQMKGYISKQVGFSLWQKLFYDHIIRNEQEYERICEYIDQNPIKWEDDQYYRENTQI